MTAPTNSTAFGNKLTALQRSSLLFLPIFLSLCLAFASHTVSYLLWTSIAIQIVILVVHFCRFPKYRDYWGISLHLTYGIALAGLILRTDTDERFISLTQAILVAVPLWLLCYWMMNESGAIALYRARSAAVRLKSRRSWPINLAQIRHLPEVRAFRDTLIVDAEPALELLAQTQLEIRVAALAALELRTVWRPGQPQIVLRAAQDGPEPEVRASAINALAMVDDRRVVEALAEMMNDQEPLVRRTATEALLCKTTRIWPWIRGAVRFSLSSKVTKNDGPLSTNGHPLSDAALEDFHSWAAETGHSAQRATLTLSLHYRQQLATATSVSTVTRLRRQILDAHVPPLLRIELATLLYEFNHLTLSDLKAMLLPTMPANIRLIAAEALLRDQDCLEVLSVLHELARSRNREIALMTADLMQRRFGLDFGLPNNKPMPSIQSSTAAEVARRVYLWACDAKPSDHATVLKAKSRPTP
ncbi:MAG: HEAT repeat domain-containing protein [Planctomycetia bacterium]|nr:HEAT repeat domain-containing protein [Planctomycetia bacterium]